MAENSFFSKRLVHVVTVSMLLFLFLFLGIVPGSKAQAAAGENLTYTFTSTDDIGVSTRGNSNETTVLIFGYTGCSYTRSTLNSIASCEWVKRPDIRVIFAETNGHTREEVQVYADGYQCQDITFCYDEGDEIFMAMVGYANLFQMNGGKYPTIVLIDKDNQVQNLLTGAQTANDILTEIQKFADIEGEGLLTPPADSDTGIENYAYGLKTIDGTNVSTRANANETTVLIFGYTTCGVTKAVLQSISGSAWVGRSDIRVVFADVYGASLSEVKEFAQNYSDNITFCHDESGLNMGFAFSYLGLYNQTGGKFPYIVLIDKNNKVRGITLGANTEDAILNEIEEFSGSEPAGPGTEQSPGGTETEQNPGGTETEQNPGESGTEQKPEQGVSNVSGLKASTTAKSVKLTWKKVSEAKGYIIYQYNSSKKKWVKKATLKTNTASYTIKKLTPGTAYRFAVKAYIQSEDGNQVDSKSYTSLYTATAPNAVNFKVTPGKKKVTITWSKVKGATGYAVYYKVKNSWKKLKSTKGVSYTKTKLKSGATYTFTVKAYKTYKGETYTSSFKSKKVKIK